MPVAIGPAQDHAVPLVGRELEAVSVIHSAQVRARVDDVHTAQGLRDDPRVGPLPDWAQRDDLSAHVASCLHGPVTTSRGPPAVRCPHVFPEFWVLVPVHDVVSEEFAEENDASELSVGAERLEGYVWGYGGEVALARVLARIGVLERGGA